MLHLHHVALFGAPQAQHDRAVVDGRYLRSGRRGDPDAVLPQFGVELFGDDAFDRRGHGHRFAQRLARRRFSQSVGAFALHMDAQERILARGHHQRLVGLDAVETADVAYHGRLALHDEGDVVAVSTHLGHLPLDRVEPHDVLQQHFARAVGLVARQEFQHGGVGHQRENQDEEQQDESQ